MNFKNILLKSTYRIQNIDGSQLQFPGCEYGDVSDKVYQCYRDLQDFSISTFKENLKGDWQLIELTGEFNDLSSSFIHTMIQTHRIWKENWPCNILYVDADIICLNELDIFDRHQQPGGGAMFLPFFWNCGVRWFGFHMPHSQWKVMYDNISNWNFASYDYEQQTYKAMHSAMNHTGLNSKYSDDMFVFNAADTNIDHLDPAYGSAALIHSHASKGPANALKFLKQCWEKYGPPSQNNS